MYTANITSEPLTYNDARRSGATSQQPKHRHVEVGIRGAGACHTQAAHSLSDTDARQAAMLLGPSMRWR